MIINKNKINKDEINVYDYYKSKTKIYRIFITIGFVISWLLFLILIVFHSVFDMKTLQMWISCPFWVVFTISTFITLCLTTWFCYIWLYQFVMIMKFVENRDTKLEFLIIINYFLVKWMTFGWWLTKKNDYKKEVKQLKKDFNL